MPSILVIEDNPTTRKLVRFTLEQRGYRILEAPDGKTALALAQHETPDLVLQDLLLPDMDGFELVGRLRATMARPNVPVLAFSGLVSKLDEARISAVGFDDKIVKPCEPSRLLQIVQAHLPDPGGLAPERFGTGRRLVIADDDPVQTKLAAFRLGRVGFEIDPASDGSEALARARARPPDAIVSDVMMPGLDGFRLCMAARQDPVLALIPIVLVTSSYIDEEDRLLAEQAGATAFVLRTPDFREVIDILQRTLSLTSAPPPVRTEGPASVEREHARRVIRQLERQVHLNAGMSQRCALLSAQLSILSGISNALTHREGMGDALDEALAACFDAGGISMGALGVLEGDDMQLRCFSPQAWSEPLREALLEQLSTMQPADGEPCVLMPARPGDGTSLTRALTEQGVVSALLVPLTYRETLLGGLLLASDSMSLLDADRQAFGSGVGNQLAQAIALARTFEEKQKTATTLHTVMDSLADGVAVVDEAGSQMYWNAAAERYIGFGTTAPQPLFRPDRVTPVGEASHPLARALTGVDTPRLDIWVKDQESGKGRYLVASGRPLPEPGRGAVAVFRDITDERAAQEQLLVSDRMASIGLLAAGLAHEINNPLAAALANLELARQDLDALAEPDPAVTAQVGSELQDAQEAVERVAEIVRDLKLFSRASSDKGARVDLHRVLESTLRLARNELRHRAAVVKEFGPIEPVEGNESRLGQVFLNLVVNAAQAIPEGHADQNTVRITTRMEGSRVLVDIADTGPGIPRDAMDWLFTPFYTTKAAGVGTGLGLAICQRIVLTLGGEITVDSELGRGTVFTVALPAARANLADSSAPVEVSPAPPRPQRSRILVVDDDTMILTVVRRILDSHEVCATSSPQDALNRLLAGESFDLILCDLMMPHITGMDVYAQVQESRPDMADRMVFFTGGAFTERARLFLEQVRTACIEKPFSPQVLRELVASRLAEQSRAAK
jgi:PAS domain S-box-containing protein